MISAPGLYEMSLEEYLSDPVIEPSLNHSVAVPLITQSPWHAFHQHPKLCPLCPDVVARVHAGHFDVGTAVHELVLEGADRIVEIRAPDLRGKAAKQARDAARIDGKIPMLTAQLRKVRAMADSIRYSVEDYPEPIPFRIGLPERVLVWKEGAIWCRARLDWLHTNHKCVDDLKVTGESAEPAQWSRTLFDRGLDLQVAFHTRGVQQVFGELPEFRFLVVEDEPPYAMSLIGLAPDALDFATHRMRTAMELWGRCLRTGRWPGYPRRPVYAEVPPWVQTRWQERVYFEEVTHE